jgi:signal transduction histidine kinase
MHVLSRLVRPAALGVLMLLWLLGQERASAEADARPLDVSRLKGGAELVLQTYVLEDPSGTLTLPEVQRASASFVHASQEASFGFSSSAFWIRFQAHNPGARPQPWLLELAYAHLDHIDLYAVQPGGATAHKRGGDHLPFAARELLVPTFVFPQETAAGQSITYYLRVASAGTVRVPLRAWLPLDFVKHYSEQNLVLWLFYGVVAAMTFYNFGTATLLKRREYSLFVGLLISLGASIFTLSGQTFQYLLPNHPQLANRALAVCMACGLLFVQLYARAVFRQIEESTLLPDVERLFRWTLPPALAVLALALFAPQTFAQLIVFVAILMYVPLGVYKLWRCQRYASAELRFFLLSFYCLAATVPIALLAHAKVFPPNSLSIWAGHIGCASYSILTSLSLPTRINDMGRKLAGLNEQLSANVVDLKLALAKAERATKVKDEFMATMSHELRTPLNAIINVPQGLLEDFPSERAASCSACGAEFLLELDEQLEAATACGKCQQVGTLHATQAVVYVGAPAHTAHFLHKIERSGHHLLQMVNGVLDFSKMEAGRLELAREPLDLRALLEEVGDQMSDLAASRGLRLELRLGESAEPGLADPVRVRQVLLNLLTNAIKFSESGSTIWVEWQRTGEADTVSVRDQGIGIAPENHERVFASFEQVHKGDTRKYGGTGLGLSISRSLVRMHGGELWVESQLGQGATFHFTLPRPTSQVTIRASLPAAVA